MESQHVAVLIFLAGAAYALFSSFIINKVGNPRRIKEIQAESARLNKKMQEAAKSKNQAMIESVNKEYEKFMPQIWEMMILQMKPMIIVLPVLLILGPALQAIFHDFIIILPFKIPIFLQHLDRFPNWRDTFGAYGWFYISIFIAGISLSIIKGAWNKYFAKKQQDAKKEFQENGNNKE
jgi:uncharacterized membrane protein (DUF106 family)